jgi:hypothetical protein
MHLRSWEATAASMVAELPADPDEPTRAWAALGSPCVGVYVPLFPDERDPATGASLVPAVLADPACWHRVDALRLRVEAARDGDDDLGVEVLAAVRATLGPLEDALWDEADDLAGRSAAADGRRAWADGIGSRLDAALRGLGV